MVDASNITPRIATEDELVELGLVPAAHRRDAIRRLFRAGILIPIRGASPGEGEGGGDGGDGGDGGEGGGDGGGEGDPGKGGEGEGGDGGEAAALRARAEKAERAAAEKDRELRDRKRSDEERERQEREAGGKFDELYKAERDRAADLEKRVAELEGELEKERGERQTDSARSLTITALESLGIRNPRREVVHIDLGKVDGEAAAKRAAKRFADENPDLVDKAPTRQKRGGGSDDEGGNNGDDGGDKVLGPARLRRHFAGSGNNG